VGKSLNVLERFTNVSSLLGAVGGALIVCSMTGLITVDVLGRYLFDRPTYIADELSGYMLVAITFLGLACTQKAGKHIEITAIIGWLPRKLQVYIKLVTLAVAMGYFTWFTWATSSPVIQNFSMKSTSLTFLHTPLWIPYLLIPIGSVMLVLQLLVDIVKQIATIKSYEDTPKVDFVH
jgi:TRAP-type C4-dicarboxylate transport system permease small subunit